MDMHISPKLLTVGDLLAIQGGVSYDGAVSNDELWVAVGRHLRHLRQERGFTSTLKLAGAADPHTQKTFDRIERGQPGQLRSIHLYCDKLGVTLADALRAVLPVGALSGQATLIAEAYQGSDLKAQQLVEMALDVPPPAARRDQVPDAPTGGRRVAVGGSRGRGRTAQGRR